MMPIDQFKFFNYPKPLSLEEYKACYNQVLSYLICNFPSSYIFQVGGDMIQPGISDVDFLLVHNAPIDGNKLYLREFPYKSRSLGVLTHEPFAIDTDTYRWINCLTTYTLKEVYRGNEFFDLPKLLDDKPIHKLVKLTMYVVTNYPMIFLNVHEEKSVNVRRTLTKLKKLIQMEQLCKDAFNGNGFLDSELAAKIIHINEQFSCMDNTKLHKELIQLVKEANKAVQLLFELFDKHSRADFGLTLPDSSLGISSTTIHFSSTWHHNKNRPGIYYLPSNFSLINQLFENIKDDYLKNIKPGICGQSFSEITELSTVWNNYLNYCNQNSILTLITDMKFSMYGHNSWKYILFSYLGNLKRSIVKL